MIITASLSPASHPKQSSEVSLPHPLPPCHLPRLSKHALFVLLNSFFSPMKPHIFYAPGLACSGQMNSFRPNNPQHLKVPLLLWWSEFLMKKPGQAAKNEKKKKGTNSCGMGSYFGPNTTIIKCLSHMLKLFYLPPFLPYYVAFRAVNTSHVSRPEFSPWLFSSSMKSHFFPYEPLPSSSGLLSMCGTYHNMTCRILSCMWANFPS